MRTILSASSSSGGVGVGVGFSFGGGGGSPRVGAMRSVCGLCACGVGEGVGADTGRAGAVTGVGVGVGVVVCVLRGRSWPLFANTLDPKINPEIIKPQTAITAVRLRFCSLNNLKLLKRARLGQTAPQVRAASNAYLQRCRGSYSALPKALFFELSARPQWRSSLPWSEQIAAADRVAASLSPSLDATCRRWRRCPVCNR